MTAADFRRLDASAHRLREQRDKARALAVHLEQELAEVRRLYLASRPANHVASLLSDPLTEVDCHACRAASAFEKWAATGHLTDPSEALPQASHPDVPAATTATGA